MAMRFVGWRLALLMMTGAGCFRASTADPLENEHAGRTAGSKSGGSGGAGAGNASSAGNASNAGNASSAGNASNVNSGSGAGSSAQCDGSGWVAEIPVMNIDRLDLLFVIDNSGSMGEEQDALRRALPRLIERLTSGERADGGALPSIRNLHLGVVSTDMGLLGVEGIPGCQGFGDDGVLNRRAHGGLAGCTRDYPPFLSYVGGVHDPFGVGEDLACIAALGTEGCGFQQPLEAALKALWPSVDRDPETGQVIEPNRILFLSEDLSSGTLGHGDAANRGFLRNDPQQGLSLIAVVVVTNEDDCSSDTTQHLRPSIYLDPTDPLASQDLNLRCFYNPDNLYPLERYVLGLQALRPGTEQLVVFGVIAGVPPDLVTREALAEVNFREEQQRERFYQRMLNDERMWELPDLERPPELGGALRSSCTSAHGPARPPRRLVEVARRHGPSGFVQSICEEDFGPTMELLAEKLAGSLARQCLPRALDRGSDGTIDCELHWHLPLPGQAAPGTPTGCDDRSFLHPGSPRTNSRGGAICQVDQLPVGADGSLGTSQAGATEGWYYDDFGEDLQERCGTGFPQRIGFTAGAHPPTGVTVILQCPNEAAGSCP